MKNFKNVITGISDEEWQNAVNAVIENFSQNWLDEESENEVQKLWHDDSILAKYELFILGNAINKIKLLDKKWVKEKIKLIKTGNENVRKGHLFELIGISYFQDNKAKTVPTKNNMPGIDAVTELDNKRTNWSYKNFGISSHQKSFEKNCTELYKLFEQSNNDYNNIKVTVLFNKYPTTNDIWNRLINRIKELLKSQIISDNAKIIKENDYQIFISKIDDRKYSSHNKSRVLIVLSPHHKNEQKNFEDNLNNACFNFCKYPNKENNFTNNILFVHIYESNNLDTCEKWVREYFKNYPHKPIDGVIFYQPYVIRNKNCSQLYHGIRIVKKKRCDLLVNNLNIQIGKPTCNTYPYKLMNEEIEINLERIYVFQRGDLYFDIEQQDNNKYVGTISSEAPGIISHVVVNLNDVFGNFTISPKILPQDDKLHIL